MRTLICLAVAAGLFSACSRNAEPTATAAGSASAAASTAASGKAAAASSPAVTLLLAPEDVRSISASVQSSGPVITGSLQPERRADLRAEVGALVKEVLKENGEAVRSGELLVRLDDSAIRDALNSSQESLRAATQSVEQTERQLQRLKTLQAQGMSSVQAMEDAETRRNGARSEQVAARSRVASAQQQLRRTEVRAPFDGVLSERKVSAGDTAQVGKELAKVIDPRSLRFEGLVSADRLVEIKTGQRVSFRVNGFAQTLFVGSVRRIDAAANATTRQVEVSVAFADPAQAPRVAGLFAEGQIETGGNTALMLPEGALVRSGEAGHVWRLQGQTLQKVAVTLGPRDGRSGEYPVRSGLAPGDRILRNPGSALRDGQAFEWAAPVAAASNVKAQPPTPAQAQAPAASPAAR